jgi:hypothetical protein
MDDLKQYFEKKYPVIFTDEYYKEVKDLFYELIKSNIDTKKLEKMMDNFFTSGYPEYFVLETAFKIIKSDNKIDDVFAISERFKKFFEEKEDMETAEGVLYFCLSYLKKGLNIDDILIAFKVVSNVKIKWGNKSDYINEAQAYLSMVKRLGQNPDKEKLEIIQDTIFNSEQRMKFVDGFQKGLSVEEVKIYAKRNYDVEQMNEIMLGLLNKDFTKEEMDLYAQPSIDSKIMKVIREDLESGKSIKEVSIYSNIFNYDDLLEVKNQISNNEKIEEKHIDFLFSVKDKISDHAIAVLVKMMESEDQKLALCMEVILSLSKQVVGKIDSDDIDKIVGGIDDGLSEKDIEQLVLFYKNYWESNDFYGDGEIYEYETLHNIYSFCVFMLKYKEKNDNFIDIANKIMSEPQYRKKMVQKIEDLKK